MSDPPSAEPSPIASSTPVPTHPARRPNRFAGPLYPFRAIAVLGQHRQLWVYVLVPLGINLILGGVLYAWLLGQGLQAIDLWIGGLPAWLLTIVVTLLRGLLIVILLIILGFLLVQFGTILGAPWYGVLSEKLERLRLGQLPTPGEHPLRIVRDIWRALLFEVKKLLLAIAIGALLLGLGLVPGVGPLVTGTGWLGLTVVMLCLDFLDPPLERRYLRFRGKLGVILRGFPGTLLFGLVCLGLVSIPLVNLVTIPLCVAGGTLFFCDQLRFSWGDTTRTGVDPADHP